LNDVLLICVEELLLDTDFSMSWLDGTIYDYYKKNNWKDPKTGLPIPNSTKLEDQILEDLWTPDVLIGKKKSKCLLNKLPFCN
jgi:hypothetical protein